MSDNVIQTSFSAGELSPNLSARVDFAKYRSGAATMRNFFVDYRSGASTRPGTEFIRPGHYLSPKIRLVRFQQSTTVTFVLEFGDKYIRFISNGSSIVYPTAPDIASITNSLPATVTTFPVGPWTEGSLVFISGAQGMPEINNRYYIITNLAANTFALKDGITNVAIDSTNFGVYLGGGTVTTVYTIATPYAADELHQLKFSQNASVMNITHPNHPPHKLTLINATNWTLVPAVFGSTATSPTTVTVTPSGAGTVQYKYTVTSVDDNNQEGPPVIVTVNGTAQDLRTVAGSNQITWNNTGAFAYNIYGSPASYVPLAADIGGIGFIGSVSAGIFSFTDSNIAADFSQTPPIHDNPFASLNPQVSSYFQQRLVYANGGGVDVATFWASKTGAPYNFDISNPSQANDAVTGTLVSLEVNEIKSLVPMPTGLLALTSNGSWLISGGSGGVASQGGPLTPTSATATPQSYIGANDVPPIVVNYDIVFIQAKGSIVRDMTYNIYANIYTGNDVSILSSHLFYGHQILEWAYAEEPFKIIWAVREDGILLSLTLVKEQDMYGWARHDTLGNFKSVATVTEGQTDATYFVVERPHPSGFGTVLMIERLADREFQFGAEDSWCVDCGAATLSNFPNSTLTVQTQVPNPTLVTVPPVFAAGMEGWIIRIGGGILKIISISNAQVAVAEVLQPITDILPNDPEKRPDAAPPGTWTLDQPFTKIFGLDHLEGRPVSVLADGGVVNGLVVHNGQITLPSPATKVIAGFGFQAQLQTMPLDLGNEVNTVQGKRKKVGALTVRVKDTRAIKAGMTFDLVTPIKELNRVTQLGQAIKLVTSDERIIMDPLWDVPGQICLQVDDPLPATVLGVIPEVVLGDSQK